jgi:hypothetical protein
MCSNSRQLRDLILQAKFLDYDSGGIPPQVRWVFLQCVERRRAEARGWGNRFEYLS